MPEQDGALFSSSMEGQSSEGALALSLFPGFERSIEEFALTCFDLPLFSRRRWLCLEHRSRDSQSAQGSENFQNCSL
jgi:hypothetical protein